MTATSEQANELKYLATQSMPYGKHKGMKFIDLPEPYVVWLYHNALPEGKLGHYIGLLYEIKLNGLESLVRKSVSQN